MIDPPKHPDHIDDYQIVKRNEKICPICNKLIYYPRFKAHLKTCARKSKESKQEEKKIFLCEWCGAPWPTQRALNGHMIQCKLGPYFKDINERRRITMSTIKKSPEIRKKISKTIKNTLALKKAGKKPPEKLKTTGGDIIVDFE